MTPALHRFPLMPAWTPTLQATAMCLCLIWLLIALGARKPTPLTIVWALFCASIAMAMARSLTGPDAGGWYLLLGLGACLTCNGFWLVSRALFREGQPFGTAHLAYVAVVAVLILIGQRDADVALVQASNELLGLLSSSILVLAFWEGLRGWNAHRGAERAMRAVFLTTYGGCVGVTMIVPALFDPSGAHGLNAICAAAAATTIVFVTQGLVTWRQRHPLNASTAFATSPPVAHSNPQPTLEKPAPRVQPEDGAVIHAKDEALAQALEMHMRGQRPYLDPGLKLSHLAQTLGVSEYRISQAARDVLGHRNVNQYINAFRLEQAKSLLADPDFAGWSTLVVGLESGFGSLAAFHRAFKATEGCTPGDFRSTSRENADSRPGFAGLDRAPMMEAAR